MAPRNILFLCTGNSARSIMAEVYVNHVAASQWRAFSAGSHPTGVVNPLALETLKRSGIHVDDAHSKNWKTFAGADAEQMDVVITVCDNAAGETCPHWLGAPLTLHWPFPDPAAAGGSDAEMLAIFAAVFAQIKAKVDGFVDEQREE